MSAVFGGGPAINSFMICIYPGGDPLDGAHKETFADPPLACLQCIECYVEHDVIWRTFDENG